MQAAGILTQRLEMIGSPLAHVRTPALLNAMLAAQGDERRMLPKEVDHARLPAYVDKGYRGHDAQNPRRVFISGQKRGVFGIIKRELRRRSAIEPIIGHLKAEGHLGRCYLKGRAGDAANVVLSAVGHNFRRILAWLRDFWCLILTAIIACISVQSALRSAS